MAKIGRNAQAGYGQKNVKGRSVSARTSSKMTSIAHNNRTPEDDFGKNIDASRTQSNVLLISDDLEDVYHELFHESVLKYNAKQKREDRKKNEERGGYLKEVKEQRNKSKKGTVDPQREYIVQFGRKQDEPFPEELSNTMFKEYLDDFQERYPDLRVYNAVIHNDEATPHMHINFVPVAEGYKTGLEKRPSFSKVLDKYDITFKEFFEEEKEKLAEIMKEHTDEDRIKVGSHKYVAPAQYREMMEEADSKRREAMARDIESGVRKSELDNREALLDDRDKALNDAFQTVLEADNNVQQRAQKAETRENALKERENALNEREGDVTERESGVIENARRLKEQQEDVKRQKMAVEAKAQEVEEKDQGADEKLSEAQNKLDTATEKDEQASKKLEEAEKLNEDAIFKLVETEKRLAEIQRENKERNAILNKFERFGDKVWVMIEAVRNGEIGEHNAKRAMEDLKTPFDNQENLDHNLLVMDNLDDKNQASLGD